MLGILDPVTRVYLSVGKVGSGFSDAQLDDMMRMTEGKWKEIERDTNLKSWFAHPDGGERPDSVIKTPESIILEVCMMVDFVGLLC
jgi:ATP-dependent DNA ligase